MSCPNGISPLLLPITNYTISSNGFTTSRGIQFGIGTPQQLMTAVPGISDSNLVIPNLQYCGSASNYSCVGSLGGAYTPKKSSTYVQTTEAQWNGTFSSAVAQGSNALIFFEDVLDFGASGYAYGFPSISPGPQYCEYGDPVLVPWLYVLNSARCGWHISSWTEFDFPQSGCGDSFGSKSNVRYLPRLFLGR